MLTLLTVCGKPLFFCSWSAVVLESLLLDLGAKFVFFSAKPLFVHGWSALFLESFLLDLGAKFACFWL